MGRSQPGPRGANAAWSSRARRAALSRGRSGCLGGVLSFRSVGFGIDFCDSGLRRGPFGDIGFGHGRFRHPLDRFDGHDHGDVLDALGRVGGGGIGVAGAGLGLEAVDFAQGALGLAHQGDSVSLGLAREPVLTVGAVDLDPAVGFAGLLRSDDVVGGEAGLDRVVRTQGGDPGDEGLFSEGLGFLGGVGRWRERSGEVADEVGVGLGGEAVGKVAGEEVDIGHGWGCRLV